MRRALLRQPLWTRVYVIVFLVVWTGGLVWSASRARPSSLPVLALMLAFGVLLCWRLFRLGVDADPDALVVHNNLRTTTIARADIAGFTRGTPPNMPFGTCLFATVTSGQVVALDVTTGMTVLARSRRRVDDDLTALRSWLADTSAAPGAGGAERATPTADRHP